MYRMTIYRLSGSATTEGGLEYDVYEIFIEATFESHSQAIDTMRTLAKAMPGTRGYVYEWKDGDRPLDQRVIG